MKKQFFTRFLYPAIFLVLVVVLTIANYSPDTWLSGWDTLHPEFNFPLSIKRAFSVWQDYQGLGAAPSQAQATELVRIPILWFISLVAPLSFVRYGFMFLTWLVGILGMYFFIRDVLGKNSFRNQSAAFVGSIFYLLNLGTIQQYLVPLSMFATHFAALPWLLMYAGRYLKKGVQKSLWIYAGLSLLFSPMAHTPTLFYVYLVSLILFGVGFVWKRREDSCLRRNDVMRNLKRLSGLLGITFLMNAYWLLPNIYFLNVHGSEVSNSSIHSSFSDNAIIQSQEVGTFKNLTQLKNFLFNWKLYDFSSQEFVDLMGPYVDHVQNPDVIFINVLLFSLALIGLMMLLFSGSAYGIGLGLIFLMGVFFWMNNNPPFGFIYSWLSEHIYFFKEGFRFPFTKFSLVLVASMSVFIGRAISYVLSRLKILLSGLLVVGLSSLIILSVKPVFEGWFIHPAMKVEIPQQYFEMFDWFDSQGDGRVLKLPMQSMYGWNFYEWGYQGAGFTWFGIKQPTLDREFDRWNKINETAYAQLYRAYFQQDWGEFEMLLGRYGVEYILWDDSVFVPGADDGKLLKDNFERWIDYSSITSEVWSSEFLSVYEFSFDGDSGEYVSLDVSSDYSDYPILQDYVESKDGMRLPFENLDSRSGVKTYIDNDLVVIEKPLLSEEGEVLQIPEYMSNFARVYAQEVGDKMLVRIEASIPGMYVGDEKVFEYQKVSVSELIDKYPYIRVNDVVFEVDEKGLLGEEYLGVSTLEKDGKIDLGWGERMEVGDGMEHVQIVDGVELQISVEMKLKKVSIDEGEYVLRLVFPWEDEVKSLNSENVDCSMEKNGRVSGGEFFGGFGMQAGSDGVYCSGLMLSGGRDYLIVFAGENESGRSIKVSASDISNGYSTGEKVLSERDFNEGLVFSVGDNSAWLGLESRSFGRILSENRLDSLAIIPLDIDWLRGVQVGDEIGLDDEYLSINKSFDLGWVGFDTKNMRFLSKEKINGWEQGFSMASDGVWVSYWPNLLEWFGLGLLIVTPLGLVIMKWKRGRSLN